MAKMRCAGSDCMRDEELKVELLCRGMRVPREAWDYYKRSAGFPIRFGDTLVSVPSKGKYDRYSFVENSPYSIMRSDERWLLLKDGEVVREVEVAEVPGFYSRRSSDGVEMRRIFQVCGWDCVLTGVVQSCAYQRHGEECRFCGTIYNPVYEGRLDRKLPEQLAEAAEAAAQEGIKHAVITSGVMPTPDRGARILLEAAKAIKERVDIPLEAELAPPEDMLYLELLLEHVDSVSINLETLDQSVREYACPGKSRIPYDAYFTAYELALDALGENQVNSWLIAGLGESDEAVIEGVEELAERGVFPFLVPLRSTKGTGYEGTSPPSPERLSSLAMQAAEVVKDFGLKPEKNRAGCMRCSACSPVRDFLRLV